ncbi:MAG: S46 family peptidase, partial [Planctomycetes bacterium]|nr:S46 family peptidase [Planctomycetota bacterium]
VTHKELGRMWPFEHAPVEFFQQAYEFTPTNEWLEAARLASLRYGEWCSASFVSPRGLIMTNHHCARDNVAAVSPEGKDWLTTGFFAKSLDDEVKIPDLTVQQLVAMKDVTEAMNAGLSNEMGEEDLAKALEANEKKVLEDAGTAEKDLTHQVVSLYHGGVYQLYSYKVYRDIRLVGAPDLKIATFGGDPDNFTYPRFSLDFSFVRAWEDGKPADTKGHYFKVKTRGAVDGETVFVVGNPGSTGRLDTVAQMEFLRDIQYPRTIANIDGRLKGLRARQEKGEDVRGEILDLENAFKAYTGYLAGLRDAAVMDVKRQAEQELRDRVAAKPELVEKLGNPWQRIEEISAEKREIVETRRGMNKLQGLAQEEELLKKRIGEAFFAVYGTDLPPDATFTLRLSDGVMKGYPMNGTVAPYFTSLYGLYARNAEFGGKDPFALEPAWLDKLKSMDLSTPFCVVSTCDIIGGNSGSPMIDKDLGVVGLVFDGNIESLGNRFVYTDTVARTVSVHPAIIVEAMRKIYGASKLADEFEGKGKGY